MPKKDSKKEAIDKMKIDKDELSERKNNGTAIESIPSLLDQIRFEYDRMHAVDNTKEIDNEAVY